MKNYKLLTPGPLTTTDTVKQEMLLTTVLGTMTTRKLLKNSVRAFRPCSRK